MAAQTDQPVAALLYLPDQKGIQFPGRHFRLLGCPKLLNLRGGAPFPACPLLPGRAAVFLPQIVFVIARIILKPAALDLENPGGQLVNGRRRPRYR
jgi:hypothetical protein